MRERKVVSSTDSEELELRLDIDESCFRDSKGNVATLKYFGTSSLARRALISLDGCFNCTNCADCVNCADCIDCADCDKCVNCNNCGGCDTCEDCTDCDYISNCVNYDCNIKEK